MQSLPSEVSVFNILRMLKFYYKQIFLLGLLFSAFFVLGNNKLMPERYETSSLIRVNFDSINTVLYDRPAAITNSVNFSQTELLSATNIGNALKKITFVVKEPSIIDTIVLKLFRLSKKENDIKNEIDGLQKQLIIHAEEPNSPIIKIKMRSRFPDYAEEVINFLLVSYLNTQEELLKKTSKETIQALRLKKTAIEQSLAQVEQELVTISKNNSALAETLATYNTAKQEAARIRGEILELESKKMSLLKALKAEPEKLTDRSQTVPLSIDDQIIQKELDLAKLKGRFQDAYPDIVDLKAEIAELKRRRIPTITVANAEHQRLRLELTHVTASLEKYQYQLKGFEQQIQKGFSSTSNNKAEGLSEIIKQLNTELADVSSRLLNEEIRFNTLQEKIMSMFMVIDSASSSSLLIKSRFVLMTGGLIAGLLVSLFFYWLLVYFTLFKLQAVYGHIVDLPKSLNVSLEETKVLENGKRELRYKVIDSQKDNNQSLAIIPSSVNEHIHYLDDVVNIEIARKVRFSVSNFWFYLTLLGGYGYLITLIVFEYLKENYIF